MGHELTRSLHSQRKLGGRELIKRKMSRSTFLLGVGGAAALA